MKYFTEKPENDIELTLAYKKLCKEYHPDVTKYDYDTTGIMSEINSEYKKLLSINENKKKEQCGGNVYVNIYEYSPRMKGGVKCFDSELKKSYLVKDSEDGNRLIENMKKMKLYNFLTERQIEKCDRMGYVAEIEYGPTVLSDFFHKYNKADEFYQFRCQVI